MCPWHLLNSKPTSPKTKQIETLFFFSFSIIFHWQSSWLVTTAFCINRWSTDRGKIYCWRFKLIGKCRDQSRNSRTSEGGNIWEFHMEHLCLWYTKIKSEPSTVHTFIWVHQPLTSMHAKILFVQSLCTYARTGGSSSPHYPCFPGSQIMLHMYDHKLHANGISESAKPVSSKHPFNAFIRVWRNIWKRPQMFMKSYMQQKLL